MRSLLLNASSTCRRSMLPYRVSSWAVLWRWVSHHGTLAAAPATASSITIRTTRRMGHLLPPPYLPPERVSGQAVGYACGGHAASGRGGRGRRLGHRAV